VALLSSQLGSARTVLTVYLFIQYQLKNVLNFTFFFAFSQGLKQTGIFSSNHAGFYTILKKSCALSPS
jgi:hypothetical protein